MHFADQIPCHKPKHSAVNVYRTAGSSGPLRQLSAKAFNSCKLSNLSPAKPSRSQVATELFHGLQAVLIPSVHVGGGNSMPGCFTHQGGVTITKGQLFLWELIMTFVLVSTVYAVAVTKPGHGNIGPLAVGFSLFASAFIGEHHHTVLCWLSMLTLLAKVSFVALLCSTCLWHRLFNQAQNGHV